MFVYLAQVDVEIELPLAVEAETDESNVNFLNDAGQIVAVFPAASVVMYSKHRSYRGAPLSHDGASSKV